MSSRPTRTRETTWEHHTTEWRNPLQVAAQWVGASEIDPSLLSHRATGRWWDTLASLGITLFVTREYEHLVMALSVVDGKPRVSMLPLPHPSGLVVDRRRNVVHVASTRNPNQIFSFAPATGAYTRSDAPRPNLSALPLLPIRSRYFPGSLYLHDLALVGGALHGNAVGQNAVVRFDASASEPIRRVWWPKSIGGARSGRFDRNYLQLNSIAAGTSIKASFFTASSDEITTRRPGQRHYPVDGRGVVFSGETREAVVRGLTRPHSARIHKHRVWVANSGYGQLVRCDLDRGATDVAIPLPGWTRGLAFHGDIAFVATSRVIPRFRQYAPGLDVDRSVCGIHAVDLTTGKRIGSLVWPNGNQIFAIDWMNSERTAGFPRTATRRAATIELANLFYSGTVSRNPF